jgi:hypothetical protein
MKKLMMIATINVFVFSTLGCGSDGMSQADASKAWAAANMALVQASTQAATNPGALTADQAGPSQTHNINFSFTCPQGGALKLVGSLTTANTGSTDFEYSSAFAACSSSGVTTDGTLTYNQSTTFNSATYQSTFALTYKGTLTFSGDVSGECEIDMTASGTNGSFTYAGTFCGFDAAGTAGSAG